MANAEGITPSRQEVERQLDRLLDDEVIASNQNSAKVLRYIVGRALDGHTVSEYDLLGDVFRKPLDVDDTTARVTMDKLRRLLKEYHLGEGQHDPVVIALPDPKGRVGASGKRIKFRAGEAYTPTFTYNPASWIAKELTVAHHLLRGTPAQIEQSLEHLGNVSRAFPDHPEVTLGYVEYWGAIMVLGVLGEPHVTLVASWRAKLDKLEKETGKSWRTHGLRALLHFAMGELQAARKEFEKALALDRQATIRRGWYTNFLFRTGKEEQALRLMAVEAEERADHAPMYALHGVYLTNAHRLEEAQRAFEKSLRLDRNCWVAHYGLTKMFLALGDANKVEEHGQRLKHLLDPAEFEFIRQRISKEHGWS